MDWSKGYTSTWYAVILDPVTWRETERIEIIGGTIKCTQTGLRASADIDIKRALSGIEQWVRVYMDTAQNGEYGHIPMFTGLASCPKRETNAKTSDRSLNCYSVLQPAKDIPLQRGWYAIQGADGAQLVRDLLSVSPAPVVVNGISPMLSTTIVAEDNETCLTMAERILTAMDWIMTVHGDGTIMLQPFSAESAAVFDASDYDVIEAPLSVKEDWYSCPNVYMAVSNDLTAIARDDNSNSPMSVARRGREVWKIETGVALASTESIAEYARRALKEAQRIQMEVSYNRRYVPNVYPSNVVTLHYPAQNVDGDFIVQSQSVEIGTGKTSETVVAVTEWHEEKEREVAVYYLVDGDDDHIVTADGDRIIFIA
jgi:hypothetical protein